MPGIDDHGARSAIRIQVQVTFYRHDQGLNVLRKLVEI